MFAPIFISIGVMLYFAMSLEPPVWTALCFLAMASGAAFLRRRAAWAFLFLAAGFSAGVIKVAVLDTRLISVREPAGRIEGRVTFVERMEDGIRVTVDRVGGRPDLDSVRVRFRGEHEAPRGWSRVAFEAALLPPFPPACVGCFDFTRYSYFAGISAVAGGNGTWEYSADSGAAGFGFMDMRERINARIFASVSGDAAGVLASMSTGERHAISAGVNDAFRSAGIVHLVSISGFHMGIVAAIVFFFARLMLAFTPLAMRMNTKKPAAAIAIVATFLYLIMSGAHFPAIRAFTMTTMAMIAVMLDKNPFSMRFVAAALSVMLVLWPEGILNPGFQMSFTAVIVLIKLYEHREKWMAKSKFWTMVRANALAAGLIEIALTPFIIYSFNVVQIYGILGNMIAMPLASFVIMPAIVAAMLSMPFGLDPVFWKAAGFGVAAVTEWARIVGGMPGSSTLVPGMEVWQMLVIAAGIYTTILWKARYGVPVMCAGYLLWALWPKPDVFVDKFGTMFGIKQGDTMMLANLSRFNPNRMTVEAWAGRFGVTRVEETDAREFVIRGRKFKVYRRPSKLGSEIYVRPDGERARYVADWAGRRKWAPK